MATSERYRILAASCLQMAGQCAHPKIAAELHALALRYLEWASHPPRSSSPRERLGRRNPPYEFFGSSRVDHRALSSQSFSVTVITPVAPSIATWPKNCNP